jgi:SAM-dependent methyltransferase
MDRASYHGCVDGYGPATYGDAFADVYDEWYHDVGEPGAAVDAIAALAAGGAVLELGVGSGRLAAPLAGRGLEVWGLDASQAMLDRLAARPGGAAVRAVLGDMADPVAATAAASPPPFAAVVVAFNTFFLLAGEAAQRSCLAGVAALLAPGGHLAIEAYVPADPPADAETVFEPRRVEIDRVVFTVSTHVPTEQVVHGQHVELRESGIRLRPWSLRYATPAQLDAMAADAGLVPVDRWATWGGDAFGSASTAHVSIYGRG